jgi:hypothetical protein
MEIKSFCKNDRWVKEMSSRLENEIGKFFLVEAEYQRPGTCDQMSECYGFDIALDLNHEEAPIIICSFLEEVHFIQMGKIQKFQAIMARKRVGFIRLPFTADELLEKYKSLVDDNKEEDLLAIELNKITTYEKRMGEIQHRVKHRLDDPSEAAWGITEVRKLDIAGSDEELIELIKNFEYSTKDSIFAGKYFPGVFCDIENTLIRNYQVNQKMLDILLEHSSKKPITLWTGGDIKSVQKLLLQSNITWKLVSKNDFAGAEVEIAYDDLEEAIFFKTYAIKVREFHVV